MALRSRPHEDRHCGCSLCFDWDYKASCAPPTRCAETHAYETDEPCQHGFTLFCPSFGQVAGAPDLGGVSP